MDIISVLSTFVCVCVCEYQTKAFCSQLSCRSSPVPPSGSLESQMCFIKTQIHATSELISPS